MRGYDATSYGAGFADVYDDWYADVTDVDATVERVASLAEPGSSVLELGVGTGRLAIPLARAGFRVTGVDSSADMLARLTDVASDPPITVVEADMVDGLPDGPFDVALVAYNTIFNLLDADRQAACFAAVARRLAPTGAFVVEAFVPDVDVDEGSDVTVRSITADRVVLSVSARLPAEQRAHGQFVEFTEAGGVRLRPWAVRWSTPDQLDAMAADAGLTLADRHADMSGAPFDDDSSSHVSVYRPR